MWGGCGMGLSHTQVWWIKIREGYLCIEESQPHTPGPSPQGFRVREISPHKFWLQKPAGFELVKETSGAPSSSS